MSRFEKQILLSGFGIEAQEKLKLAKVLVIGAGGLGCPALLYLASAGVGTIGICDGDIVAVSNLNRQIIFAESDCNKKKAEVAGNYLKQKYHDINVEIINDYLTKDNALKTISQYDLIIDGSDNFATRYLVNDACVLLRKPLSFGAVFKNEGQVAAFNIKCDNNNYSANYRDIFPEPPASNEIYNCRETGVLGVLPGIIGVMMASEAIKIITGFGEVLINKMLFYNLITNSFFETKISKHPLTDNLIPKSEQELLKINYNINCDVKQGISWAEAFKMKNENPGEVIFLDIREHDEEPKSDDLNCINIPLTILLSDVEKIPREKYLLMFCQTGTRSEKAVTVLGNRYPGKKLYSVDGGITQLNLSLKFENNVQEI
jgi:sulfur-carrier protein adenylyltransferase/sulfurtransferase